MKKIFLFVALSVCYTSVMLATTQNKQKDYAAVEHEVSALQSKQKALESKVLDLTKRNKAVTSQVENLKVSNSELRAALDSAWQECGRLSDVQKADKDTLSAQIGKTDESVRANNDSLSMRTTWGIAIAVALLLAIGVVVWLFQKKFKSGSTSIDEVRKAQDTLEKAQNQLQEESVKLDSKLLEIVEKQLSAQQASASSVTEKAEIDHSLTLKVADEITKIEMNLSRMDSSVKGYKQLSKAVQRIKDNFSANGYEIVDMLGKPYNEGMRVVANFVPDDSLEEGKQIITGIIKPQINYRGVMIQAAQITVSQNI